MKDVYGLFEQSHTRTTRKGEILIYEGDPVSKLYYIVSGYVKVYNILDNGAQRTIFIYGPGDIFPFSSYLSGSGTARYFYETMSITKMKSMTAEDFALRVRDNVAAGEALIHYTLGVGEQFMQRIDALSANSARQKVISGLAFLAHKTGQPDGVGTKLEVPMTTQELANMCGLTRETASLQLSDLRKKGIISGSKFLTINKPASLNL